MSSWFTLSTEWVLLCLLSFLAASSIILFLINSNIFWVGSRVWYIDRFLPWIIWLLWCSHLLRRNRRSIWFQSWKFRWIYSKLIFILGFQLFSLFLKFIELWLYQLLFLNLFLQSENFFLLFYLCFDLLWRSRLLRFHIFRPLSSHQPSRWIIRIIKVSWNHQLLSLFSQSISKHIIYICWCQLIFVSTETFIHVLDDLLANEAFVQNVNDCWPVAWLYLQHLSNQISEIFAVDLIQRWKATTQDFDCQPVDWLCIKGMPEVAHFVEDAAKCPNIWFVAVWLIFEEFWRHIIRSSNACISKIFGAIQHLSNSKITKSNFTILQKDVLSLHISV